MSAVLPVLVVPNETLWSIEVDQSGAMPKPAAQVNHCSVLMNYHPDYTHTVARELPDRDDEVPNEPFTLTHLEVVTLDGLSDIFSKDKTNPYYALFFGGNRASAAVAELRDMPGL